MKNPLIKCLALFAAFASASFFAFAQDAAGSSADKEKIPAIRVQKVDFKQVAAPVPGSDKYKWGQTLVDFVVDPNPSFDSTQWLNNVNMTLTLVYKKTARSLGGKRGSQGKDTLDKAAADAGSESAKYTSYRAKVTFASMKVSDGKKQIAFYIPGEILERDKEVMTGTAKPLWYYIEFEYDGLVLAPFDAQGKVRPNYVDSPAASGSLVIKQAADLEKVREWADSGVADTKGQLIPMQLLPGQFKFVCPYIVRDDVQQ